MASKQKTRRRPHVESVQKVFTRDEHQLCSNPGCKNVVAVWSKHSTCSRCRQ